MNEAPERSQAYLRWVASTRYCAVCGPKADRVDPHHWSVPGLSPRGVGTKASDYSVVPLCSTHHREFHQRGAAAFASAHNLDPTVVIEALLRIWLRDRADQPAESFLERVRAYAAARRLA